MKKIQRFVVEYKSGRRNVDPKSNSIWGSLDLKSVARDLQQEAAPLPKRIEQNDISGVEAFFPKSKGQGRLLTQSIRHPTTVTNAAEATMADETETTTNSDAQPSVVAVVDIPKKQRKPRAKKAAPETASIEAAAEQAPVKKTRGRKLKLNGEAAKGAPVRRGLKSILPATPASNDPIDEMTDILQLDEENQRLRKLLAQKLRAENADLRKRLNLG